MIDKNKRFHFKNGDPKYVAQAILQPDLLNKKINYHYPDEESVKEAKDWVDFNQK